MDNLVYFYPEGHAAHAEAGHPERPERIESIRLALEQAGLWTDYPKVLPQQLPEEVLHAVHSHAYLNLLEMASRRGGHLDADTYVTTASWELARKAAGGAVSVASAVWGGYARRGFALTRPPGHHATHDQALGFCLLNNVAIAAQYLVDMEGAQHLAIIDLDLHHGNGTQDIFWERGDILYISTHQSPLYPGSGRLDETGVGAGAMCTANFPLPPGSGDQAFQTVMDRLILPLLNGFKPQMILVSYGFDPHWSDPLGHLLLSGAGYHTLIARLVDWAEAHCAGRIALFLEGGYNLDAAAVCSQGVVSALLNQSFRDTMGSSPYNEGETWQVMVERAIKLWGL